MTSPTKVRRPWLCLAAGAASVVALSAAMAIPAQGAPATVAAASRVAGVDRWSGSDRYDASANISATAYPTSGVTAAYVASGEVYTDALSGAPAATKDGGPMLLVRSSEIPGEIATELARLKPKKIYVLGGPATISASVETQLNAYTTGDVERLMGADRFEASAQISQATFSGSVDTAYVASGRNFPDALSGAPVAGMKAGPMLLVDSTRIPQVIAEELGRLKPKKIVVLGGPNSVSDGVATELTLYTKGFVERWWGEDRYEASAEISANSFDAGVRVAYVAYGAVFSDALSGAPVAGKTDGPMLLVGTTSIPSSIRDELTRLQPQRIVVLGGPSSVSESVEEQLGGYVVP